MHQAKAPDFPNGVPGRRCNMHLISSLPCGESDRQPMRQKEFGGINNKEDFLAVN
jgi:hypothetical protein